VAMPGEEVAVKGSRSEIKGRNGNTIRKQPRSEDAAGQPSGWEKKHGRERGDAVTTALRAKTGGWFFNAKGYRGNGWAAEVGGRKGSACPEISISTKKK